MNWTVLKSLNQLYELRKTKIIRTLKNDSSFQLLVDNKEINTLGKFYYPTEIFNSYYEKHHKDKFPIYFDFLERNNLLKKRFEQDDIEILIELEHKRETNTLIPTRQELIEAQETVRGFSLMWFDDEKYLTKKPSLVDAINLILGIKLVDNKSQQYLYKLQCHNPKLIVLCENLNFLLQDKMPRENNFELWYAGGRNVPKLEYTETRGLPIYYSADWDKDGLEIFELAKEMIPKLQLLFPNAESRSIIKTKHKSHWKNVENPNLLSDLTLKLYNNKEQKKIKKLIINNHWITEEANDLKVMIDDITK